MRSVPLRCEPPDLDLDSPRGAGVYAQFLLAGLEHEGQFELTRDRNAALLSLDGRFRGNGGRPSLTALIDLSHIFARRNMSPRQWLRRNLSVAFAARRSSALVVPSEAVEHGLRRYLGVDPSRIVVVEPRARPAFKRLGRLEVTSLRRELGLAAPYVIFVGTKSGRKNLPTLQRAFMAAAGGLEPRPQLILAGEGKSGLDGVREMGFIPLTQLPGLLSGALAYVNPSFWEGSSIGAEEAMACGTPALVSARGALPKAVEGGGLALDPEAEGDWVEALSALFRTPSLRSELSLGALGRSLALRAQAPDWSRVGQLLGALPEPAAEAG